MTNYFRIRQGLDHGFYDDAFSNNYVGLPKYINLDFPNVDFGESWEEFNGAHLEQWLEENPGGNHSKGGQFLASIFFFAHPKFKDSIYLVPDGIGEYQVGLPVSDYYYVENSPLALRKDVKWIGTLDDESLSDHLRGKARHGLQFIFLNEPDIREELGNLIDNSKIHLVEEAKQVAVLREAIAKAIENDNDEMAIKAASDIFDKEPPGRIIVISEVIKRNPRLARLAKIRAKYICEICNRKPFIQRNGNPFAHADHIQMLGGPNGGLDHLDNMRCLCAHCHAVVTYGNDEEVSKLSSADR